MYLCAGVLGDNPIPAAGGARRVATGAGRLDVPRTDLWLSRYYGADAGGGKKVAIAEEENSRECKKIYHGIIT